MAKKKSSHKELTVIPWHSIVTRMEPYIIRLSTPGGWGTGFVLAHSTRTTITGIATAAHVIKHAHSWENPIRIQHPSSGKSFLVRHDMRAIYLDDSNDTAVLLIPNILDEIPLPTDSLTLAPKGSYLTVGNEIGWLGFPAIPAADLCFFSGRISAWSQALDAYLVDGNAINGVSGGPAVSEIDGNLFLIGVVSDYVPNRMTGETLPGLALIRSIERFHADVAAISSFDQAKESETPVTPNTSLPTSESYGEPTRAF